MSDFNSLSIDDRLELIITYIKDNPESFSSLLAKPYFQELLVRMAYAALTANLDTFADDLSEEMCELVLADLGPIVQEAYEEDAEYFEDIEYREYLKKEMRLSPEQRHYL